MQIAIAQIYNKPSDFEVASRRMLEYARQSLVHGADLIVYPMCVLTGPYGSASRDEALYNQDLVLQLDALAHELPLPALVPISTMVEDELIREVIFIEDGAMHALVKSVNSRRPFNAQGIDEPCPAFSLAHSDASFLVALDDTDLERLQKTDLADDYDGIIYLPIKPLDFQNSASMGWIGALSDQERNFNFATTFIEAHPVGAFGNDIYPGASYVIDPRGTKLAAGSAFADDLIYITIPDATNSDAPVEVSRMQAADFHLRMHMWETLTMAIKHYMGQVEKNVALVKLDGTLESALTLALTVEAIGPLRTQAVSFIPQDSRSSYLISSLAERLHVKVLNITMPPRDVFGIYNAHNTELLHALDFAREGVLAAALEDAAIATLCDSKDAIYIASFDKTAVALGEVSSTLPTKTYAPLADIYRSDVMRLPRLRNQLSPLFSQELIDTIQIPLKNELYTKAADNFMDTTSYLAAVDLAIIELAERAQHTFTDALVNKNIITQALAPHILRARAAQRSFVAPFVSRSPLGGFLLEPIMAWSKPVFEVGDKNIQELLDTCGLTPAQNLASFLSKIFTETLSQLEQEGSADKALTDKRNTHQHHLDLAARAAQSLESGPSFEEMLQQAYQRMMQSHPSKEQQKQMNEVLGILQEAQSFDAAFAHTNGAWFGPFSEN